MTHKTNILFFSHSAGCHGAEKSFITLLKHIDRSRFCPLVVIPQNGPMENQLQEIDVNYHIITMPRWVNWEKKRFLEPLRVILAENKAVSQLIDITKSNNIDIIYSNTIANRTGAKLAHKLNLPHIWHIREILSLNEGLSPIISQIKTLKIIEKFSDIIITNSKETSKQFTDKNKTKIVYNSIENVESAFENSFNKQSFNLLYIGVMSKLKSLDTILNAIKIINENKLLPCKIKFTLAGEGSQENNLKLITKSLSLEDNVVFSGYCKNIYSLMAKSDLFVFPSYGDSWGRVIVEAMLTGLPVIGANAGGIPEIITDSQTGFLAKPKDPNDWAEKIAWVYNNYDQALKLGQNAKEYASRTYTIENYVGQIEKIIGDCIEK